MPPETRTAQLPRSFARIVEDFAALSVPDRRQLLLEFSQDVPVPPERLAGDHEAMERIAECQSPAFVKVELDGGPDEGVRIWFDIAREAPTTRGFAGILLEGLQGLSAAQVLAVPDDVSGRLGLGEAISPLRLAGMAGMLGRIKRQIRSGLAA